MRSLVVILLAAALCDARPSHKLAPVATLGIDSYIIGGVDANPNEFPMQLSQTRNGGHSCGATLLNERYALSAAHCVDGAAATALGIWAGLYNRADTGNAVFTNVQGYRMHEAYGSGPGTFPNDIAIITFTNPIGANGGSIQYARLPADNNDQFVGQTATLSGWGRNSASNVLPQILQKVDIPVISQADCNTRMQPVSGASTTEGMICFYSGSQGSCNGDSGGPAHLNGVQIGTTSWGISGGGACLPSYPSVYTRNSFYLGWIAQNTP